MVFLNYLFFQRQHSGAGPRWADVRITVPLTGRADSSASIGRGASSRPISSLLIGCVGLTESPSAAPTAWEKIPSRSEYQSERSSGGQKEKRGLSEWTDGETRRATDRI